MHKLSAITVRVIETAAEKVGGAAPAARNVPDAGLCRRCDGKTPEGLAKIKKLSGIAP